MTRMMISPTRALRAVLFLACTLQAAPKYSDWKHSGSMYILTTPEGAKLPAGASEKGFPLLFRLHKDFFDFRQAKPNGQDIRFSTVAGTPLAYEIEQWDKEAGTASIWVRIPLVRGNDRQEIKIHWGNAGAKSASDGKAVFNASNGYVCVWHLGREVRDVVGNIMSEDKGTTPAAGVIGGARHFPGKKVNVFCGDGIQVLPTGGSPHSTQAWLRPERANGPRATIVGWGNEERAGKVPMVYASPPQIRMDCYMSNGDVRAEIPDGAKGGWAYAVHTFEDGQAVLYINGEKRGLGNPKAWPLAINRPARMWIGGWYNNWKNGYIGETDEVRISSVARSAHWVRLEYDNQKPLQTLVGPVVQDGAEFSLSPASAEMKEGETVVLAAKAGGAQKITWSVVQGAGESVLAVDRFKVSFDAGRVTGDETFKIRFDAVYPDGVRSLEVPVKVTEALPEPEVVLRAPTHWDGRQTIEIRPEIKNLRAMQKAGVGGLDYRWQVSGLATIKDEERGKLVLSRAQNSGTMTVTLTLSNGGAPVTAWTNVVVQEPKADAWVHPVPGEHEMPAEGQFYARDDSSQGTMYCKGTLENKADEVFLRVSADGKKHAQENSVPGKDKRYSFAIKLKPGLIKYRVEFGTRTAGKEAVLHRAGNIVCGDAYLVSVAESLFSASGGRICPCRKMTHPYPP